MALHQKWAKVQLPQKAQLGPPKITFVLHVFGYNPSTTFKVDQNRRGCTKGHTDSSTYGQTAPTTYNMAGTVTILFS